MRATVKSTLVTIQLETIDQYRLRGQSDQEMLKVCLATILAENPVEQFVFCDG